MRISFFAHTKDVILDIQPPIFAVFLHDLSEGCSYGVAVAAVKGWLDHEHGSYVKEALVKC